MHIFCVAVFCVCLLQLCPFSILTSSKCPSGSGVARVVAVHTLSTVILDCQCESSGEKKWEYCSSSPVFQDTRLSDKRRWPGFSLVNNYSLRIQPVKQQFEGSYVCWCNRNKTRYYLETLDTGWCLGFPLDCIN